MLLLSLKYKTFCRLFFLQKFGKTSSTRSSTFKKYGTNNYQTLYCLGNHVFSSAHPISPGRFVEGGGSDLPLGAEDGGHGL